MANKKTKTKTKTLTKYDVPTFEPPKPKLNMKAIKALRTSILQRNIMLHMERNHLKAWQGYTMKSEKHGKERLHVYYFQDSKIGMILHGNLI